jgi:hypothetical protein
VSSRIREEFASFRRFNDDELTSFPFFFPREVVANTPMAFDLLIRRYKKQIRVHETETWNIAEGRSGKKHYANFQLQPHISNRENRASVLPRG